MPHDPALDPAAILAALGVTNATAITPVQGGSDTAIWRVAHGGVDSALRVFRPEQAATCRREVAAMGAAHRGGVPVPEIRASATWRDRPALLLEWCRGAPLAEAIQRQPWQIGRLGRAFGRAQARIHQIPAAGDELGGAGWIAWAGDDPQIAAALRRLAQPAPALLHLDYHLQNVLADRGEIRAVLDWANARAGDPRADIARTYTILMVEPYVPGRQPLPIAIARRLLTASWRRGYAEVGGEPRDMAWFYAWAGAVMLRDLAPRVASPQSWWEPRHLAQIQRWAGAWRRRALAGGPGAGSAG
jgi:aminoglycoside phosphotransferase (APT) family kinase protein